MSLHSVTSNPLTVAAPCRQSQARAWLVQHRVSLSDLASRMGVSKQYVAQIISGQRVTPARIRELVALGMPEELLPIPALPRRRGRPPKARGSDSEG